jgi:hypothetical protein
MENNAHKMEEKDKRLARFQNGTPHESISTLLNSIANFHNNEIKDTLKDDRQPQTGLMFMGVHAAILTISKVFWNLDGLNGYKKFLEVFVDGSNQGTKFSQVSDRIHDWRNVLAHQWLGSIGHEIVYDYTSAEGWKTLPNGSLSVNPDIYCKAYLAAFGSGGKIWDYEKLFTSQGLEDIKTRIIDRYIAR